MKRKTTLILLIAILLFVAIGAYLGIRMYNKPHINVTETAPDTSVSPQGLVGAFEANEPGANSKYLDKIIRVSGKIAAMDATDEAGIIIFSSENSPSNVTCYLTAGENEKFLALKKGEHIAVKGICTGYLMDVVLINCVIEK